MQIAFVTLFLGLTLGAYPVELTVEGPVRRCGGGSRPAASRWRWRRSTRVDAEDVSTVPGLRGAVAALKEELASQRIVWVEGTRLPQSISLSPSVKGLDLP